ncbi:MAG TPA: response regulator, partial [Microthrixaceae bacterium]|nr:response regulator [Microthrixaceae bacterium]
MNQNPKELVLAIEDEAPIRKTLEVNLRARGYGVALADNGTEGVALARVEQPDVVLLDLGLPDKDGILVISEIRTFS